jgi:hypothetical protein
MDGPTALGEFVVRESAPSQGFKAGLFEVVEMDRVIDVSEGVQLVGTSLDYRFGNGQFAWSSAGDRRGLGSLLFLQRRDRIDDARHGA